MTTIWCMVPETPRATDRIFCHFGPIFHFYSATTQKFKILKKWKNTRRYYHLTQVYHKQQSYDVWFLRYGAWQTKCLVILDYFLHFYPSNNIILDRSLSFYSLNNPKNQNFEKMKTAPRDTIILHKCTINDNHILYCSWDMKCDRQNFLSFWIVFSPFPWTYRGGCPS